MRNFFISGLNKDFFPERAAFLFLRHVKDSNDVSILLSHFMNGTERYLTIGYSVQTKKSISLLSFHFLINFKIIFESEIREKSCFHFFWKFQQNLFSSLCVLTLTWICHILIKSDFQFHFLRFKYQKKKLIRPIH